MAAPRTGLLDPSAFLPAAEDLGLVAAIDRVVLAKSVELLGLHRSARPIAVNLSERSFGDLDLVDWLGTCLRDHDVDPGRLVVELTETVLMDQEGVTANQIRSCGRSVSASPSMTLALAIHRCLTCRPSTSTV